jgi:site-specific DNA recombinase
MHFNRWDSRSGQRKAEAEHIMVEVPPIVDVAAFDRVQSTLKSRNPRNIPPRVVSGPILLTGLAVCASCSGGMTLRTGTSRSGEVHKYYTRSTCARQGKSVCKGRSIRMDKLDWLVTGQLIDRLLTPERLSEILSALATRCHAKSRSTDDRVRELEMLLSEAEDRLRRLYKLVEDGVSELDDILKARISALKEERAAALAALERVIKSNLPGYEIDANAS